MRLYTPVDDSPYSFLQISKKKVDDPHLCRSRPSPDPSVYTKYVSVYPPRIRINISHPQPKGDLFKSLEVGGGTERCSLRLQVIPKRAHSGPPNSQYTDALRGTLYFSSLYHRCLTSKRPHPIFGELSSIHQQTCSYCSINFRLVINVLPLNDSSLGIIANTYS